MDHDAHSQRPQGKALTSLAISATLHCLTGCAIGEVLGMVIGTALGWSDLQTIALAVALAFLFGYALTIRPVMRSGLELDQVDAAFYYVSTGETVFPELPGEQELEDLMGSIPG